MDANVAALSCESWAYYISGLQVQSDFPLHGSIASDASNASSDIHIRLGEVPAALEEAVATGPNWTWAPPAFLFEVPGVVRFLVRSGSEIVVAPAAGCAISDAAIFVVGTGIAVALYQRGALILHASAVVHEGRAFAFSGPSGAGKSTLAALLSCDGCAILSDDVSAVDLSGPCPVVQPDGRRLRLWEDVIDWMDLADRRGLPVRSEIRKYHVDFPIRSGADQPPLRAIYLLTDLPKGADPTIELLPYGRAAFALDRLGYRRLLSDHIGERAKQLERVARLLGQVPVYLFSRSLSEADNPRSLAALKAHWASLA